MKKIIVFILLIHFVSVFAQNDTKLFYSVKDKGDNSYIGVKDENGKVVIPVEMHNIQEIEDGVIIKDRILSFCNCPKKIKREEHSWGCVFDRKGNYLYQSFRFDNGPDYNVEGYQRIVKNRKIGFTNKNGEIVIEPQFDFATSFNSGYARFCNDCHWKKDGEHQTVVDVKWGIINFKGEKVFPLKTKKNKSDVKIKGNYYPSLFPKRNK